MSSVWPYLFKVFLREDSYFLSNEGKHQSEILLQDVSLHNRALQALGRVLECQGAMDRLSTCGHVSWSMFDQENYKR